MKTMVIDFPIDAEEYKIHQNHLLNGIGYEDSGEFETIETYSVLLKDDYVLDLKVCNAPTENGGAWVDPVIFEMSNGVGNEVWVGDVLDSIDEVQFDFQDTHYIIRAVTINNK